MKLSIKYDSEGTTGYENRQHISNNAESESVQNNLPAEGIKHQNTTVKVWKGKRIDSM